ncbi:hypothetical protein QC764_203830 [Podospora pseudoanserina]|uniref:Apple domain-containing protein n=1 Tax=Podospora pseudoanserina TaxID=2609844 RepID=A0ABR0IGZ7_9PEZI|nr:hypothetical protein QC764_203830 [Podospora pseudoanserina]
MILKALLLATLAAATPLLSPKLISLNPTDSDTEIYKSVPSSPPQEVYRSFHPHSSRSYLETGTAAFPAPAACTTGPAASSNDDSGFNIGDYTLITSSNKTTSYQVEKTWYKKHLVSGPHWFGYSSAEGQFGAWKCQFLCNAEEECNGYFVWFEARDEKGRGETMKCNLFDAVIPESALVSTNATGFVAGGAYDRICKEHVKST